MPDQTLSIDLESLTIAEIEEVEDIIDGPIDEAMQPGQRKGKVLRALGFIIKRRDDPNFTLEDAGKLVLKLADQPLDPTNASG